MTESIKVFAINKEVFYDVIDDKFRCNATVEIDGVVKEIDFIQHKICNKS